VPPTESISRHPIRPVGRATIADRGHHSCLPGGPDIPMNTFSNWHSLASARECFFISLSVRTSLRSNSTHVIGLTRKSPSAQSRRGWRTQLGGVGRKPTHPARRASASGHVLKHCRRGVRIRPGGWRENSPLGGGAASTGPAYRRHVKGRLTAWPAVPSLRAGSLNVSEPNQHRVPMVFLLRHRLLAANYRNDLNAARSSAENSSGCSHAAKCPPLSTS
jgi:hypothetical protein